MRHFPLIMLFATACGSQLPHGTYRHRVPQQQEPYSGVVASVGRVLLTESRDLGGLSLAVAIELEYEDVIRELPEELRAEFFFIIAIKTHLDASFARDFVELVARDCPQAFERRTSVFLDRFSEAEAEIEVKRARVFRESVRQLLRADSR
jgi:hypothetical protein